MRVHRSDHSIAEIHRIAKETGEPIVIVDDDGVVVNVLHVPGPLPPEPIDKVRDLLANPPKPEGEHLRRARQLTAMEAARLLALVDAVREAARE